MRRGLVVGVIFWASLAQAQGVRFDVAGDPFEGETVFRLDLELPIVVHGDVVFGAGYGQRSFWTLENAGTNDRVETDFAPRVFLRRVEGLWTWQAGYVHESNGRLNAASRSWNRIVGRVRRAMDWGSAELAVWTTFRVEDTNPDLRRNVGDGTLVLRTRPDEPWRGRLRVGFTFDPSEDGPIPNVQAQVLTPLPAWVFPQVDVKGLVEARWGRGESLLRNAEITRVLRLGLSIAY